MVRPVFRPTNGWFLRLSRRHTASHSFFEKYSKDWWNIDGCMSILHDYNQVRVPFIARSYLERKSDKSKPASGAKAEGASHAFKQLGIFAEPHKRSSVHLESVLRGLDILDVGCGGGILTESLAKHGCRVLGIDPNERLIEAARAHKREAFDNLHVELGLRDDLSRNLEYRTGSVYDLLAEGRAHSYDIVVASEVLEHIDNREKEPFLEALTSLVRPEGVLVITTPGSSLSSFLVNVLLAERVLNRVPRDTHDFSLFISPRDCRRLLSRLHFEPVLRQGLLYVPFLRRFFHVDSCDLLYMHSFAARDGVQGVCA